MESVLAKENASFMRQLEITNPDNKFHYMQSIDISKHIKNLSVRYVSTTMPSENNLDDWIVLPLFQHGQDIPIDNDGRTAILVAHAPSLENLLKSWHERIANERVVKEKRQQQKLEKRASRKEGTENRKRKENSRSVSKSVKFSRNDTKHEIHPDTDNVHPSVDKESEIVEKVITTKANTTTYNIIATTTKTNTTKDSNMNCLNTDEAMSEFGCDYSSCYDMSMGSIEPIECDITDMDDCGPPVLYGMNSPLDDNERILDLGIHNEECVPGGEDWTCPTRSRGAVGKQGPLDNDVMDMYEEGTLASYSHPETFNTIVDDYCLKTDKDDLEDVLEMERQLAVIQAGEAELDEKDNSDLENDIHFESDHAASNLEREMNGEAMECKKFTETLLRVEPSCVVIEPVEEEIVEQPASTKPEKKQSASSRIKYNLLQRMAEGRDVDVDATNAAASENDYKNTFCYLCRIDFSTSKGLYLHNVKTHSEGEVQCDVCFKPLKNRITLMKHKKLHLGAEDMQCLCTDCGRPFKDKRALTAHVTYTKHMLGVPFTRV